MQVDQGGKIKKRKEKGNLLGESNTFHEMAGENYSSASTSKRINNFDSCLKVQANRYVMCIRGKETIFKMVDEN